MHAGQHRRAPTRCPCCPGDVIGDLAALLWHPPGLSRIDPAAAALQQEASAPSRSSRAGTKRRGAVKGTAAAAAVQADPAAVMPGSTAAGKLPVVAAETVPAAVSLHAVTPMRLLCCSVGQV